MMRMVFAAVVALGMAAAGLSSGAQAATLTVTVDGQLAGATGVNVGGTLYDVEFVDGSCIALFGGCDEASDSSFTTLSDARLASQALLDQVFIDGPLGAFDTSPELTVGITSADATVYTLYDRFTSGPGAAEAINLRFTTGDRIEATILSFAYDTSYLSDQVFARWSVSPMAPVPLPAAGWLLIVALMSMAGLRRRARLG